MADCYTIGSGKASSDTIWYGGLVPDPATDTITIGPELAGNGGHVVALDTDWHIVLSGGAPFNLRETGRLIIEPGRSLTVSSASDTEIDGIIDLREGGTIWWNPDRVALRCHAGHKGPVIQRGERSRVRYGVAGFRIIGPTPQRGRTPIYL